jgi:hypothetical protein
MMYKDIASAPMQMMTDQMATFMPYGGVGCYGYPTYLNGIGLRSQLNDDRFIYNEIKNERQDRKTLKNLVGISVACLAIGALAVMGKNITKQGGLKNYFNHLVGGKTEKAVEEVTPKKSEWFKKGIDGAKDTCSKVGGFFKNLFKHKPKV